MKISKKLLCLVLALLMALSFVACSKGGDDEDDDETKKSKKESTSVSEQVTEASTAAPAVTVGSTAPAVVPTTPAASEVTVYFPAGFTDEAAGPIELDDEDREMGIVSGVINPDGTATLQISADKYDSFVTEMMDTLNIDSFKEEVADGVVFADVKYNSDFSVVEMVLTDEAVTVYEETMADKLVELKEKLMPVAQAVQGVLGTPIAQATLTISIVDQAGNVLDTI